MCAVAELRHFTRRFTKATGLLRGKLYDADLSLTDARILYEIAQDNGSTAENIRKKLDIDKGYLSRSLRRLEACGWIKRAGSEHDKRIRHINLTSAGRELFARIDQRSTDKMERLIGHLAADEEAELLAALSSVARLLKLPGTATAPILRPHRIGDLGWIIHRHGVLYHRQYGWDISFEGAVAEIASSFVKTFDAARDRCLIAEINGEIAGSATVVHLDDQTAKLRIVYVEPWARGQGIGELLVSACMAFARDAGYRRMKLWTNDVLVPARRLYTRLGFELVKSEPHDSFGKAMVGEIWQRDL